MVAPEPTGASALTVALEPMAPTAADNSTESVSKNDAFDEIKNKFLNEIDKIPRELRRADALLLCLFNDVHTRVRQGFS